MERPPSSFSISLSTSNLFNSAHRRFASASSPRLGTRPSSATTPRRAATVRDRMTKKRRSLSIHSILDSPSSPSTSPTIITSPRASPPPAFLLDDDPFANLSEVHRVSLSPPPSAPPSPNPKATTKPFSPRSPTPAHQKPAFAPKPSLPSLDALSRMNIVLTKKVRKGRVGAGLPFEPWDHTTDPTNHSQFSTRQRRPSTSPSSFIDTLPSLLSSPSEPAFIQPDNYNPHPDPQDTLDMDLLATCGVDFDSSSVLSDTPPRSKFKGRKQSIALDQPPPEFFSSKSRSASRRPSTSTSTQLSGDDHYHDIANVRNNPIDILRVSVPLTGSTCNTSPGMEPRRSQSDDADMIAGSTTNIVSTSVSSDARPLSFSNSTTSTLALSPDLTPTSTPTPVTPELASSVSVEQHSLTTVPEHPSDLDFEHEQEEQEDEEDEAASILLAYTTQSPIATCPNSPTPTPHSLHFGDIGLPALSSSDHSSTSASVSRASLSLSASSSPSLSLSRSTSSSRSSTHSRSKSYSHSEPRSEPGPEAESGTSLFNSNSARSFSSSSYGYISDDVIVIPSTATTMTTTATTVTDGVAPAANSDTGENDEFILYNPIKPSSDAGRRRYGNIHHHPLVLSDDDSHDYPHHGLGYGSNCPDDQDMAVNTSEGNEGNDTDMVVNGVVLAPRLTGRESVAPVPVRTPPRVSSLNAVGIGMGGAIRRGLNNTAEGGECILNLSSAISPDATTTATASISGDLALHFDFPTSAIAGLGELNLGDPVGNSNSNSVVLALSPLDPAFVVTPPASTTELRYSHSLCSTTTNNNSARTSQQYREDYYPPSRTFTELDVERYNNNTRTSTSTTKSISPSPSSSVYSVSHPKPPLEQHDVEGHTNTRTSTRTSVSVSPLSSDTEHQQHEATEDDMLTYSNRQRLPSRSSPSPTTSATSATSATSTNGASISRSRYGTATMPTRDLQQADFIMANGGGGVGGGVVDFDPYRNLNGGTYSYSSYSSPVSRSSSRAGVATQAPPPSSWYSIHGGGTVTGIQQGRRSSAGSDSTDDEKRRRQRPDATMIGPSLGGGGIRNSGSTSGIDTRTTSFVPSSSSEEEEQEDSEATDDNVPLARSIPGALVAQKSIRKQVREERDQRRKERAATSSTQTSAATSASVKGGEQPRNKQAMNRPTGSPGGSGSAVFPQTTGMYSSSQEAAMYASALSRSSGARPSTAPGVIGRPRTQTLPGRTAPPFAAEDLTKKLQEVVQVSSTSGGAGTESGRHRRYPSAATAPRDADPYAMFPRAEASLVPPVPVSAPVAVPIPTVEGQSSAKPLRPQRSFHRPATRPSAIEDHRSIPLPSNAPQQLHRVRSQTKLRDDYTLRPSVPVPRLSEEQKRLGREPSVRSATSARPSMDGYLSSTGGNSTNAGVVERRPSSRRPSTADRDRSQRPPVPPLPPSVASSSSSHPPQQIVERQVTQQRVFIGDMQSYNVVEIDDMTSAGDVIEILDAQGSLKGWIGSGEWMVWELAHDFGMERPVRNYERLSDVQASWNKDKLINAFVVRLTSLAPLLTRSAIPSASPKFTGYVEFEVKRGKWSKRWLQLREHSLWISKRDNGKDGQLLCSLSNFDAYHFCRPYKSPKPFTFAVKSTDKLSFFENTADYKHVMSCSEKDGKIWMEKILLARSYVLHQERNVLFNPKSYGGQPTVATRTPPAAVQRRPAQPFVSVAKSDLFEPGSLLHRQR